MAWPVGDKSLQPSVRAGRIRTQLVEERANRINHIDVHLLRRTTDVVGLPEDPTLQHRPNGPAMVFDKQPIADVLPFAVDGQRLALNRIADDQRDKLFRELVGTIVVGAVGRHYRHLMRVEGGPDKKVACRLACRVGAVRRIRCQLGKRRIARLERSVDLICGDMKEPEFCLSLPLQLFPITPHRIK